MEEFETGVRDLHEKVGRLDELLRTRTLVADLSEKRADAAHAVAEETSKRVRRLVVAGLVVALGWTPLTAYGAVWIHEKVRNNCYPGISTVADVPDRQEPWYCGMFPGTNPGLVDPPHGRR